MLSGEIAKRYAHTGLPEDTIWVSLRGSAGQSFGAWLAHGVTLDLVGEANDYVGKGLSGGRLIVRPVEESGIVPEKSIIVGNTVLYGAIAGECYFRGVAGERFAVRNSGAIAVVEGTGDHGCEYMTGGLAVVLGTTGINFGAGMTGGMAFVYDKKDLLPVRLNGESVIAQRIAVGHYETLLRNLVIEHHRETASPHAEQLLVNWDREVRHFWQIVPKDVPKSGKICDPAVHDRHQHGRPHHKGEFPGLSREAR